MTEVESSLRRKFLTVIICLIFIVAMQTAILFWLYDRSVKLQVRYGNLLSDYNSLQFNYDSLSDNYTQLQEGYNSLVQTHNSYTEAYRRIQEAVNLRSIHPTEQEKTLVTPDDPNVQNIVLSVTGGWSNPTDWNELWEDYKKLYDWVVNNIEYRADGFCPVLPSDPTGNMRYVSEMWQLPNETLSLRKGDCEDMSLLLQSLLYCYNGKKYAVYCIAVFEHMATFCPVANDEICILDPAMKYYTNTGLPSYNITSKDVRQEVTYWINHYNLVEVEWIFSLTIWKSFTSTEDFINWMYTQT